MASRQKSTILVNTFAVFGYISLCFQWLWTGVAIVPTLLQDPSVRDFLIPQPGHTPPVQVPISEPLTPFMPIVAIVITAMVVLVSAIILIRLPIAIAKTGKKTVQSTAEAIIPVITHNQKLPEKKKKILTFELVKLVKFSACMLPIGILLVATQFMDSQISNELLILIGTLLALGSMLWFSLEYIGARLFKVQIDNLL